MTNYVLHEEKEKPIEVKLEKAGKKIVLKVGRWNVFELRSNGMGYLCGCIPLDNGAGLQVTPAGGRLRVE